MDTAKLERLRGITLCVHTLARLTRLSVEVVVDMGPRGEHVFLNFTLLAATQDAEITAFTPPGTPRVGRNLQERRRQIKEVL